MKIKQLKNSTFVLIFVFALSAFGQTSPIETTVSPQNNQTATDENFQLNITNERITETNFARSINVELAGENRGGLRLEVGVGVRAEQINVLLRGITGQVRFRASLDAIKKRLDLISKEPPTVNSSTPPQQP